MTSKVSRLASTIPWSGIQTFPVYFCHLGSLWYLRLLCYVSLTVMLLVPLVLTIVSPVRCLTMLWPSSKGSQQSKCTQWNFMFILYRTWSVHLFMLCRPFGRLWWDEIVPTVVTRAEPHNQVKTIRIPLYIYSTKPVFFWWLSLDDLLQIILYPSQARVLTIRENARLQGFPDYYRLFGPIKQK